MRDRKMKSRDEHYVIEVCDRVLQLKAQRQHRFAFLLGDPGKNGVCRTLPVDAYYPELNLVIEYREKQHTKPVAIFDKRVTCSGCTRGKQRKLYDQRRQDILGQRNISLIKLEYDEFSVTRQGRLRRNEAADECLIRQRLSEYLAAARASV